MIAKVVQTDSRPDSKYTITENNSGFVIGNAETITTGAQNPVQFGKTIVYVDEFLTNFYYKGNAYSLKLKPENCSSPKGELLLCYPMFVNGTRTGVIALDSNVRNISFFRSEGFHFQTFSVNGEGFRLCEVGLGDNKHYLCLHRNETLVAVVHISDYSRDFRNNFMVYAEDENSFIAACIALLYIDAVAEQKKIRSWNTHSVKNSSLVTPDKSLRAQFDPTFIPRIKERDGYIKN